MSRAVPGLLGKTIDCGSQNWLDIPGYPGMSGGCPRTSTLELGLW